MGSKVLNVWRDDDITFMEASDVIPEVHQRRRSSRSWERQQLMDGPGLDSMAEEMGTTGKDVSDSPKPKKSSKMLRKMSSRRSRLQQQPMQQHHDPAIQALQLQKEVLLLQKQILDKGVGLPSSLPVFPPPVPIVTEARPSTRVAERNAMSSRPTSPGKKWVMALVPDLPQSEGRPVRPRSKSPTKPRRKS
jgi:hypothetical protein